MANYLSPSQVRTLYNLQVGLGVNTYRMAHIRSVRRNFLDFAGGGSKCLFNRLSDDNRQFEDKIDYTGKIKWFRDKYDTLPKTMKADLETAVTLHDIGYGQGIGSTHALEGYQLLGGAQGEMIWERASLIGLADRENVRSMVKDHALLTDIGLLHPSKAIEGFSHDEMAQLAVLCMSDALGNVRTDYSTHNMLFSRQMDRYKWLLETRQEPGADEKIRGLFGPIPYVWLNDEDFSLLRQYIRSVGLPETPGFKALTGRIYFTCWPMLKDMVTPEIEMRPASYYTPLDERNLPGFSRFLYMISRTLEQLEPTDVYTVTTAPDYFTFRNAEERLAMLSPLRRSLAQRTDLELMSPYQFRFDRIGLDAYKDGNTTAITLSVLP